MTTIRVLLAEAQSALCQHLGLQSREARIEAQLLLQSVLGVNHAWLLAHETDILEENIHAAYKALIQRRLNGEPIAYILGKREFYGLEFEVTPATLIPRPDTETLVEAALAKIPADTPFNILDLGTGTGAIALAIAHQRPQSNITAVDASEAALAVANKNRKKLNITNTEFLLSDWYAALVDKKFDVIVSNPPYIESGDVHLQEGDLRFEPISALASGTDGLDDIRRIVSGAPAHLSSGGWLMLEHGYNQASKVAALMQKNGFSDIFHAQDLAEIDRVTLGRWI